MSVWATISATLPLITAIVAATTAYTLNQFAARREILRQKRIDTYRRYLNTWVRSLQPSETFEENIVEHSQENLAAMQEVLFISSPPVVRALKNYQLSLQRMPDGYSEYVNAKAELILAMRTDVALGLQPLEAVDVEAVLTGGRGAQPDPEQSDGNRRRI